MAVIRWEPAAELATVQSEMDRLFDALCDPPGQAPRGNGMARRWVPAMDLVETEEHYVLRADLPGLSREDVEIELQANVLTVSGERRTEHDAREEGYHRVERAFGSFARSLTLPQGADPDTIQAKFDRGVLEIRIPKPHRLKARRVTITTGGAEDDQTTRAATPVENGAHAKQPVGASA